MGRFVVELDKFKAFVSLLDSMAGELVKIDVSRVGHLENMATLFTDSNNYIMADISCPVTILDGVDMKMVLKPWELAKAFRYVEPSSTGHSVTIRVENEEEMVYIDTGLMTLKYDMNESPDNIKVPKRINLEHLHQAQVEVDAASLYSMIKIHDVIEDTHLWTRYDKMQRECIIACGEGSIEGIPESDDFGCGRAGVQNTVLNNESIRSVRQLTQAKSKDKCLSMYGQDVALMAIENAKAKRMPVMLTVGHNCPM